MRDHFFSEKAVPGKIWYGNISVNNLVRDIRGASQNADLLKVQYSMEKTGMVRRPLTISGPGLIHFSFLLFLNHDH